MCLNLEVYSLLDLVNLMVAVVNYSHPFFLPVEENPDALDFIALPSPSYVCHWSILVRENNTCYDHMDCVSFSSIHVFLFVFYRKLCNVLGCIFLLMMLNLGSIWQHLLLDHTLLSLLHGIYIMILSLVTDASFLMFLDGVIIFYPTVCNNWCYYIFCFVCN